uniref:Uncharacterized protein n=1 Tax=Vespula pensylvanica TaxID=30213 RepID=A0A834UD88_VESPE|nr:hypothetical protein H0235_004988 [Vespula pensylvanica]
MQRRCSNIGVVRTGNVKHEEVRDDGKLTKNTYDRWRLTTAFNKTLTPSLFHTEDKTNSGDTNWNHSNQTKKKKKEKEKKIEGK